jgi:hypothetical protein
LQQSELTNPDTDSVRQLQDEYNRKLSTYDANHPDMYRVAYSDGSLSDMVNLTRARDAAKTKVEDRS